MAISLETVIRFSHIASSLFLAARFELAVALASLEFRSTGVNDFSARQKSIDVMDFH
jgi:hypothetical protein